MTSLLSLGFNSRDLWGYQWQGLTLQLTLPTDRKKVAFCRVKDNFFKYTIATTLILTLFNSF